MRVLTASDQPAHAQLVYEHGTINNTMPFDELRRRSHINERAKAAGRNDYSERIRDGLPARLGDD